MQAADETPEASLFGGAITPLPVEQYARGMRPQRALGRTCLPSPLHPRGFFTGANTIFGPNLLLRRSEALRSLKGPFVLGSSSVLTVGKRVFARGDVSEMIVRLEREGAKSMSVPEARASLGPGLPGGSGFHAVTGTELGTRRGGRRAASLTGLAAEGAHGH